jgi:hypothetical protein
MSGPSALRVVPHFPDRATMGKSAHLSHSDGVWVPPKVWLGVRVTRGEIASIAAWLVFAARPAFDKRYPSAGFSPLANEDVLSSLLRTGTVSFGIAQITNGRKFGDFTTKRMSNGPRPRADVRP